MKIWKFLSPIIAIVLSISSFSSCTTTSQSDSQQLQQTVDSLSSLQNKQGFPDHLNSLFTEEPVKREGDFDVNEYFNVLTHISMESGYVLDWVYCANGMGGVPVLYSRKVEQSPYLKYSDFEQAVFAGILEDDYLKMLSERIRVDGTAEGYFEFFLLAIMGTQFYRFWHSHYGDVTVICDRSGLDKVMEKINEYEVGGLSLISKIRLKFINFKPLIRFKEDIVMVKVIVYAPFFGFFKDEIEIKKDFPHEIIDREIDNLIEYSIPVTL